MTASTGAPRHPAATTFPPIPLRKRLYGFGSIYGKTLRDSRLSFIIAAGMFGGLALVMGAAISTVFPDPAVRKDLEALVGGMPPSMVNLFGNATLMGTSLGTLGGWLTFKYGALFALGTALWSIMALTGTLAGEASRGSLDFVAVSPFGKRRIAVEKLAAHLTVVWGALAILAVMLTISSNVFGDAAMGDQVPLLSSVGFALWVGVLSLFFGGLAFAMAPLLGRAGAAGISALLMILLWVSNGLEIGGPLVNASPFRWMNAHIPLVGMYDWTGVLVTGLFGVVFLVIGLELFNRRDLGVTSGLGLPTLPASVLGVHGPISRAFGDLLPRALAWGLGMAIWGALFTSLVGSFSESIGGDSSLIAIFGGIFPGFDFTTTGAWLQLYMELFLIAVGFAATTFVAKWASDETSGRLEMVLSSSLTRARWVLAGGAGALLAVVVMTVVFSLGIGLGSAAANAPATDAIVGSASLGLVAAAFVGVGVAIGGLWRTSIAAEITAILVVITYLVDLLSPPLGLPDWFRQLALTAHMGKPMIGDWDPVGIVACLVIAVGGILLGAWGIRRRDVAR